MRKTSNKAAGVKGGSPVETPVETSTPTSVEAAPAIETPKTPVLHLLPLSIGNLANHAGESATRFALNGVRVEFGPGNTFKATATDTKVLVHVEGQCVSDADEFPDSCIPALAHAPNGAMSAIIPAGVWRESFRKAKALTKRTYKRVLKSLAVVTGETTTTLAATDLEKTQCDSTPNIAGKFAPFQDIIDKERKRGQHVLKLAVDPQMLAGLLTTIANFNGEDSSRAEFVIRFDIPVPEEGDNVEAPSEVKIDHPFLVEAKNESGKLTGLMMPLAW